MGLTIAITIILLMSTAWTAFTIVLLKISGKDIIEYEIMRTSE